MIPKTTLLGCGSMSASGNESTFFSQNLSPSCSIFTIVKASLWQSLVLLSLSWGRGHIHLRIAFYFTLHWPKHTDSFLGYVLDNLCSLCFVIDFRVVSDRLVDQSDMKAFVALLGEKLASLFDLTFHNICPNKESPIFGTLLHTQTYTHSAMSMSHQWL